MLYIMQAQIRKVIELFSTGDRTAEFTEEMLQHPSFHRIFREELKRYKKVFKRYHYMITWTLDPSKHSLDDAYYDEVEAYIVSQHHRSPLQIVEAHLSREGADEQDKHVHWHSVVTTTTPLKRDRFQYFQKKFGFVHISGTKAQSNEEAINYISKQVIPTRLI